MSRRLLRSLQRRDRDRLRLVARFKHLAVQSGPEPGRHVFAFMLWRQDLDDTFLPAFRDRDEEGVEIAMAAYDVLHEVP